MKFDNDRDRYAYGMDIGTIVEGIVKNYDGKYIIVDEDGVACDPQIVLSTLEGKKIRFTVVAFETIENLEKMLR
jgi:hypothetical protein